jgi:nucleotide-binding universal stress UspA family protein
MSVREILLATDFSDLADEAVRVGREYAQRFAAGRDHVYAVRTVRRGADRPVEAGGWAAPDVDYPQGSFNEAVRLLQQIERLEAMRTAGGVVETRHAPRRSS